MFLGVKVGWRMGLTTSLPSVSRLSSHWRNVKTDYVGLLLQCLLSSQSRSHITTEDQSVSPSWWRTPSGSHDPILISVWHLLFFFVDIGRPLWREVGSVICINYLNCFSSAILLLAIASYFTSDCLWSAFFISKRHKPSRHVKVAVSIFNVKIITSWIQVIFIVLYFQLCDQSISAFK
jgi:hypothetical protein